jgi:hypothetical protein
MFFGHVAAGLAAKPAAPKASLGVLLIAAMGLDTLCGIFSATGVEYIGADAPISIPWSHGLFMSLVWSAASFGIAFLSSRNLRTSLVIALVVFSHWVLDFIAHPMGLGKPLPPDLPLLFGGSPKVGLGLYNNLAAALPTELGLFAAGIAFYLLKTKAKDRTGAWVFWLVPLFLLATAFYRFLPPQLSLFPTFAVLLLLPLGTWIDRHRSLKEFPAA